MSLLMSVQSCAVLYILYERVFLVAGHNVVSVLDDLQC